MSDKSVIIIIMVFLFFITCQSSSTIDSGEQNYSTIGKPVSGDWVIISLSSEPSTLNPIISSDAYESIVNNNIMESLIQRDLATLELKPQLAYKWEISADKMQYTFYLRKGIKWHDNIEFTAEDVIFSYNKIMDPKVDAAPLRNYYRDIKKVEMIDKYTVKFTYNKPYFLALEFCGGIPVMPKHLFTKGDFNKNPQNRHPVGTGPYIFEKWDTGKEIILQYNPDYWQKEKAPKIKKIVYKIITDDTVRLQLLKKGDLDLAGLTPIQWARQTGSAKFRKNIRKLAFYMPYFNYIGWNLNNPLFADQKVRLALSCLIDRDSILKNLLFSLGQITTGPFYIFSKAYDPSVKPYPYDEKKARELMALAGWKDSNNDNVLDKDGKDFKFTFLLSQGNTIAEQIATVLKENFKKAGIVMEIRKLEWATFIQQVDDKKFDAVMLGWSMGIEQDPYQIWHSSQIQKGSNFVGYKNKHVDELIEKARMEFNEQKRNAMYREIHRIIYQEQPYAFLFCNKSLIAVEKRFQNTKTYNLRPGYDLTEWWVPLDRQKFK